MNLSFDSLTELTDFIDWLDGHHARLRIPAAGVKLDTRKASVGGTSSLVTIFGTGGGGGGSGAGGNGDVAFDTPPGATETKTYTDGTTVTGPGALPDQSPAQQDAEPAKRKRRTKAEIEAAAAAEANPEEAAASAAASVPNAGEASLEAARTTLRDKVEPAGTNPFEQVAVAVDGAASGAEGGGEAPNAEADAAVTPFLHLTRAREFIAKHGMPKYNESFTKAGLDPNVMGYNAEQRAQHMATLADLDKA